ncbi:MAG: hypothetical protein OSB55_15700, partial [Verrucomicrobiota bacterium]|nr:hypothetical protein [Verrucomicrobiota bacterium]
MPTLKEIGHRFGLTHERIHQLQNGALAKLRKPSINSRLHRNKLDAGWPSGDIARHGF